jgi:hypothetical protein
MEIRIGWNDVGEPPLRVILKSSAIGRRPLVGTELPGSRIIRRQWKPIVRHSL